MRTDRHPAPGRLVWAAAAALALHLPGGLLAPALDASQALREDPPEAEKVYLMTMGPGDRVWERFGHNSIWISYPAGGTEIAYSWGFFDFRQADFIPRFLRGRMLYLMGGQDPLRTIHSYREADRSVTVQELNLTPEQRLELRRLLAWNARPENAFYRYQYFLDNCSTRVRDALDRVLDGQLEAAFARELRGASFRDHARRLTEMDLPLYLGMDLLLGNPGDRPVSVWQEMFVPMVLRDEIREVTIRGPGGETAPLVLSERVLFEASRDPEPAIPGELTPKFLALGLLLGGAVCGLAWLGRRAGAPHRLARAVFLLLAAGWSLLGGLAGLILVAVLFTDHQFMWWNENLLQANPLGLVLAALLLASLRGGGRPTAVRRLSALIAAVALLGFLLQALPGFDQGNGPVIALALPVHLALAWALRAQRTSNRRSR